MCLARGWRGKERRWRRNREGSSDGVKGREERARGEDGKREGRKVRWGTVKGGRNERKYLLERTMDQSPTRKE